MQSLRYLLPSAGNLIVFRLVASRLLVQITDHVMKTGLDFHVACPKYRDLTDSARKVRDWLASQA